LPKFQEATALDTHTHTHTHIQWHEGRNAKDIQNAANIEGRFRYDSSFLALSVKVNPVQTLLGHESDFLLLAFALHRLSDG
jgi:hypothetical protein